MSEPSGVVVAGAAGVAASGFFTGVDGNAVTGAICGAVVFAIGARDYPLWQRLALFLVSLVMGYKAAPALAEMEMFGIRPFTYSATAAFVAAALVVVVTMAAIKQRQRTPTSEGPNDG